MVEPEDWWTAVDAETLRCLSKHGPMTPDELGKHLGMSEEAAASLVSHLVSEGKVRICLVQAAA
jgi:DNA-binding Lrp family transcriptional regulator